MCFFPNIEYVDDFAPLNLNNGFRLPSSPRAMLNLLINRNIVDEHFIDGIDNMTDLETEIFNLIDNYPDNNASLERVFHLIQIWGGRTGRGIYVRQQFNWLDIEPLYRPFVNYFRAIVALDANNLNNTLDDAITMIRTFYNSLRAIHYRGMGVAFITKHSRFWMHRNLPNNMLPIYDSTFSINVMQKGNIANMRDLRDYWQAMFEKAAQEHVSLSSLERQLFNYYQ